MSKYKDPQEHIVEAVRIGKNQAYKSVFAGSKIVFVLEGLLLIKLPDMLELKVETQYLICIPKVQQRGEQLYFDCRYRKGYASVQELSQVALGL